MNGSTSRTTQASAGFSAAMAALGAIVAMGCAAAGAWAMHSWRKAYAAGAPQTTDVVRGKSPCAAPSGPAESWQCPAGTCADCPVPGRICPDISSASYGIRRPSEGDGADDTCPAADDPPERRSSPGTPTDYLRTSELLCLRQYGLPEELERIAFYILCGCTYRQIGQRMHLSEKAVKDRAGQLFARLGATGRNDFIQRVHRLPEAERPMTEAA